MAWRVAVGVEDSHARRDFSAALDQLPVLPFRKILGDAPTRRLAAFGQLVDAAIRRPEFVLDFVRDEFSVRERQRVGSFLHQAPDVVGVKMRDENGADVVVVDARGLHVGGQIGGVRLPLSDARTCIHHDRLVADLQHDDGQRDRHEIRGQARLRERRLGLFHRDAFDEGGIMGLAPDPVIYGCDLDRADLVLVVPDSWLDRRLGESRAAKDQWLAQP